MKKITPILLTHDVRSCVAFWATLGLTMKLSVPAGEGDQLAFAILAMGDVELMYQSFESAAAQDASAVEGVSRSIIYVDLEALTPILALKDELNIVKDVHETAYGLFEIYIRDPAGNLIGFAAPQL